MQKYKLQLLGLSEVRWNGQGEHMAPSGETLIYCGKRPDEPHESGVGFLLSKQAKKSLLSWNPISDRIITARFYTKYRKITFVQCYAPTEPSPIEDKNEFYEQLASTLNTLQKGDIVIVMGDMNAKLGNDNINLEGVLGKHGLGTMNENGELLTNLCANFNLVIGGTLFPHKRIHKITWTSPDKRTENQIDHITISKKWRSSLLDVRNKRGADIASDHYLLIGDVRLKLAKINKAGTTHRVKFDLEKLNIREHCKDYKRKLKERSEQTNTTSWVPTADVITQAAEEAIGIKQSARKEWISDDTWQLIEQRKRLKLDIIQAKTPTDKTRLQTVYQNTNKRVKRSARKDKRRWYEDLANKAQRAAENNNMRTLYQITKQLGGKTSKQWTVTKDKHGKIATTPDEQLRIWKDHFTELLGTTHHEDTGEPNEGEDSQPLQKMQINSDPPSKAEISKAIKALKNNKAAGPDNIPNELFKADTAFITDLLHPLIKEAWETNSIPKEWKQGLIIKLPKKGDLSQCQNWRGIMLLNSVHKVLVHIIHTRLSTALEPTLRVNQAGFRPNHSCIDHINTLRIIIEQSVEWKTPLYLVFVDYRRAFDSISHKSIWRALKEKGVPEKLIEVIKELYREASCKIIHNGQTSESFNQVAGVRQGCTLSPLLFNIVLDWVLNRACKEPRGIQWSLTSKLTDLDYADDICLTTQTHTNMSTMLAALAEESKRCGLEINIAKTKAMLINTEIHAPFIINGTPIETVRNFSYLGSVISVDGGANDDINSRLRKATQAFGQLKATWNSRQISTQTKLRIFTSNVQSVLLYGSETWKVTKTSTHKLQVFINRCLRRILKIFWPNTIRNEDLLHLTNQQEIHIKIRRRKWGWIGHTLRKPTNDIARKALDWNPQGKRKRGRPVQTWKRSILDELKPMKTSWEEAKDIAKNRTRWRAFTEALCSA